MSADGLARAARAGVVGGELGDTMAVAAIAAFGDAAVVASVLARVGGELGARARARATALAAMAAIDAGSARRERAMIAATARAPVPAGLRGVHASWIEHALAAEPVAARAAVASGGGGSPTTVWLARRTCAELPGLPAAKARWPSSLADAIACDGATLHAWLAAIGADQLALAVGAAGGHALEQAAVALGAEAGGELRAAAARVALAPRAGETGGARAAIARCRGVRLADGLDALIRIGARAIAPHAADALVQRQLAVRLPRALGMVVAAELAMHAAEPLERAPTWTALAARR